MRKNHFVILLGAVALLAAIAVPVVAHHAFGAEFDRNAPVKLQGKVVKLEWVNPHTWIHLEIENEDGTKEVWAVEGGTPNVLLRRGLRRDCLEPGTEMLGAPNDGSALEVDVRPQKLANRADAVPRLVREHQRHVEPPVHLARHLQKRPVLLLGEHHPVRVLLRGRPEPSQRIPVEQQPAPLVSGLRRPIQDGDQELEVVFDRPVGYGPSARSDPARPPLPDEAVPIPLGQGGRVAVPSEEAEEHVHGGPVVPPRMRALGGRHLLTVDVKELLQCERLGLGFRIAPDLGSDEPGSELVRLPLRAPPIAVFQRPGEPSPILAPLDLEQAGLGIGEDPHPVPAPFAGAVGAPASFRACHHSIPLVMDCTICATETSRREAVTARRRCPKRVASSPKSRRKRAVYRPIRSVTIFEREAVT